MMIIITTTILFTQTFLQTPDPFPKTVKCTYHKQGENFQQQQLTKRYGFEGIENRASFDARSVARDERAEVLDFD